MATKSKKNRAGSDAYVGMLFVSLVAMIIGSVLLYLDFSSYTEDVPVVSSPKGSGPAGSASGPRGGGPRGGGSGSSASP
jgi:hypothetical protein